MRILLVSDLHYTLEQPRVPVGLRRYGAEREARRLLVVALRGGADAARSRVNSCGQCAGHTRCRAR